MFFSFIVLAVAVLYTIRTIEQVILNLDYHGILVNILFLDLELHGFLVDTMFQNMPYYYKSSLVELNDTHYKIYFIEDWSLSSFF